MRPLRAPVAIVLGALAVGLLVPAAARAQDDPFEENDTRATASPWHANRDANGEYKRLACLDEDWFAIRLDAPGNVEVSISILTRGADLDLTLESATQVIARSATVRSLETCRADALPAGTYYARIHGYRGARGYYSLAVSGAAITIGEDAYEPNDSLGEARPMETGEYTGLACLDDDWYSYDVPADLTLTVELAFRHLQGDLDLTVYGPGGATVARSQTTTDSESITISPPPGTYYIHVFGYRGARATYSLSIAGRLPGPGGSDPTTGGPGSTTPSDPSGGGGTTGPTTPPTTGGATTTPPPSTATRRPGTALAGAVIRSGPALTYPIVLRVNSPARVVVIGQQNGYYRLEIGGYSSIGAIAGFWIATSSVRLD